MPQLKIPRDLDAEVHILGSCLQFKECIVELKNLCEFNPSWMSNKSHKSILEAIYAVFDDKRDVNLVTVNNELKSRGLLKTCGGTTYLSQLTDSIDMEQSVKDWALIVESKYYDGQIQKLSLEVAKGLSDEVDVSEKTAKMADLIFKRNNVGLSRDVEVYNMKDLSVKAFNQIESAMNGETSLEVLNFGLKSLGPIRLKKKHMCIIAGRPSMGKTSLVNDTVFQVAKTDNVFYFSLEVDAPTLYNCFLSKLTGVSVGDLETGNISDYHTGTLNDAISYLSNLNLYIVDASGISPEKARHIIKKSGIAPGMVVFDYIQLMRHDGRHDTSERELASIVQGIKGLTKDLNCYNITVSQLSRAVEQRQIPRPIPSDLRGSGELEQAAEVVMFVYRPSRYGLDGHDEIIVSKNKFGPIMDIEVEYHAETMSWRDLG